MPVSDQSAVLAKILLYVNAAHTKRELEQVRLKLLRFGEWLRPEPDGGWRFEDTGGPPSATTASAPAG